MKKLILLVILICGCNIEPEFDPVKIKYQAVGNVTDIVILLHDEYVTYNNWIGEFNYTYQIEDPTTMYISVTNINGGNVVGAIYADGLLKQFAFDPAFVELTEVIK